MEAQPTTPPPRRVQVKIEVPADLQAIYANFTVISHSPSELFLDFVQLVPQQPKARVQARVVMTPANAKLLHRALGENIAKYEAQFGEIAAPTQGPTLAQQLFRPPPQNPEGEE
jgi:hypothetical protein